jgi:hypothetical protein
MKRGKLYLQETIYTKTNRSISLDLFIINFVPECLIYQKQKKNVRKFVQYGLIYFGTTIKLILNWLNKLNCNLRQKVSTL